MTNSPHPASVDLRGLAGAARPGRIHALLLGLGAGDSAELIDDRDPGPLLRQLLCEAPLPFTWEAAEAGGVWRARLARAAAGHGEGRCCGGCGGH